MLRRWLIAAAGACALGLPAAAQDLLVEKKSFTIERYTARNGQVVANMRIGYQTAGRLNAAGDNAVYVAHFFSANSHAFGRFAPGGPAGYWDAIIGPDKPIDTNRFFVVAADTPVNLNTGDPNTITTGPATVNPATGRPYALSFPVLSMRDFVETQKALLDSLGVKRLALVAGASMGALQAIEWAAAYPEMVDRVMSVIGASEMDGWVSAWLNIWASPIRLDPNWREGDYYGATPPNAGLADALKIVTLHARDAPWAAQFTGKVPDGQNPARAINDRFTVEKWLDDAALARAKISDANHFLYLVRANQLFLNEYPSSEAALARSNARWLVVPSIGDHVFPIAMNRTLEERLRKLGKPVVVADLAGPLGHLEGVVSMAKVSDQIRTLLGP